MTETRACRDCGRTLPIEKFGWLYYKARTGEKSIQKYRRFQCSKCKGLWFKYKMSAKEYYKMLEDQHYCCLICEKTIDDSTAYVDHCHKQGHVRALLCNNCNAAIGFMAHDKDIALRAVEYITHHVK